MTSLRRRFLAAGHRGLFATLTLLEHLRHGCHSFLDRDPHLGFRTGWRDLAAVAVPPRPAAPARPGVVYPHAEVYAVGTYQAATVLWSLPLAVAQALLPSGLELGPQQVAPPGEHPVLLMFGHHQGVRPNFLHVPGMEYLEFLVAVPHVQWVQRTDPYRGPFAFLPRLFLDRWLPTALGWL